MANFCSDNIRLLRQRRRLTQQQLAVHIGCSQKNIQTYEVGYAYPRVERIIKIAAFFEITIDDLLLKELKR